MHLAQELARLMDLDQKFAESNKTIEHYKSLLEKHRLEIPEENLHNEDDFMISSATGSTVNDAPSRNLPNNATDLQASQLSRKLTKATMAHPNSSTSSSNITTASGDYSTPPGSANIIPNADCKSNFYVDLKDLPPPDIDDPSVNFTSVHHTNPSSEFDDDGLIPESTHLGYRNPPEIKHNPLAGHGPIGDPQMSAGVYMPTYLSSVTTVAPSYTKYPPLPTVELSHERYRFGQNQPAFDNFPRDVTQQDHIRNSLQGSSGALHSLPTSSVRPTTGNTRTGEDFQSFDNQLSVKSSSGMFTKQNSMPDSGETCTTVTFTTSSTITVSTMAAMISSTTVSTAYASAPGDHVSTAFDNQYTSTSTTNTTDPVLYGNVPVCKPVLTTTTTTTTAVSQSTTTTTPAAPKHGKLDLEDLRRKSMQATASLNIEVSQYKKQDLSTIKKHLDKKHKTRAQVEDLKAKPPSSNYGNIFGYSQSARAAAQIDNPTNRRPTTTPRSIKDCVTPLGQKYEYWVCACCEIVNGAKRANCKRCMMACGALSVSHAYCKLCNLLVYISEERMSPRIVCPLCKDMLHTVV
ncbi:uncharacterized protein [Dysidea avara]